MCQSIRSIYVKPRWGVSLGKTWHQGNLLPLISWEAVQPRFYPGEWNDRNVFLPMNPADSFLETAHGCGNAATAKCLLERLHAY